MMMTTTTTDSSGMRQDLLAKDCWMPAATQARKVLLASEIEGTFGRHFDAYARGLDE
jgi:hypothetical protein